ncbi:MAG: S1C family serine protease [Butyrivibrio sp.]|nr:S1C family serine protease [Butyrivibrio sp.]
MDPEKTKNTDGSLTDTNEGTSPLANTDFMREKIKQRPINKKKLLRRTLITMSLAVVFGAVACLTFVFLSPVINDKLYPEQTPAPIALTEETVTDEMQPEDMYADDNAIASDAYSAAIDMASNEINRMQQEMNTHHFDSSDYIDIYSSLKVIASTSSAGIVTVTSVTSDTNWFNDPYESTGSASGIIAAENGTEYLILVASDAIEDANSIQVTFCDGTSVGAYLKMKDSISELSVIAVREKAVPEPTREKIKPASLGSSNSGVVTGTPVIAIGSPTGVQGSICYGFVTSSNSSIDLADSNYKLLTTDMYGSSNASGALINLSGSVVGFINMSYNSQSLPNVICAIGITELRTLIEELSNGTGRPYLGLHGQTIPEYIQKEQDIPEGAYITMTDMDSPAMLAGIQSGDIITEINGDPIPGYDTLISKIVSLKPDTEASVTLMRQATEGYVDLTVDIAIKNSATGGE